MLFKTHRHSFLTALVAVLALAGSAGCWGMVQSLTSKGFSNVLVQKITPAKILENCNAVFSSFWGAEKSFNDMILEVFGVQTQPAQPKRGYLSRFGHYLLSFVKPDAKVNGFWNKTGNIVKNFSKFTLFTGIAALAHYCALPTAQSAIQTALCYGVMTLGYTLGGAAAIRMVQAPFVNGWNVGTKGWIQGTGPDGQPITQEQMRI